jgi:hypothetical protein
MLVMVFKYWCYYMTILEMAELLAALHEADQGHRDLKPDNAVLSIRTHEWTLLELASAANIVCAAR